MAKKSSKGGKDGLETHRILYRMGMFLVIGSVQDFAPKGGTMPRDFNFIKALRKDAVTLKELKLESLSDRYNEWADYLDGKYLEGQIFDPADRIRFSQDASAWAVAFWAELKNMPIQKAERKVERKLRELTKKIESLEDKIDELQENWRVDITK